MRRRFRATTASIEIDDKYGQTHRDGRRVLVWEFAFRTGGEESESTRRQFYRKARYNDEHDRGGDRRARSRYRSRTRTAQREVLNEAHRQETRETEHASRRASQSITCNQRPRFNVIDCTERDSLLDSPRNLG